MSLLFPPEYLGVVIFTLIEMKTMRHRNQNYVLARFTAEDTAEEFEVAFFIFASGWSQDYACRKLESLLEMLNLGPLNEDLLEKISRARDKAGARLIVRSQEITTGAGRKTGSVSFSRLYLDAATPPTEAAVCRRFAGCSKERVDSPDARGFCERQAEHYAHSPAADRWLSLGGELEKEQAE